MDDLPLILHQDISFSCFYGLLHGKVTVDAYDQGDCVFPVKMTVNTNIGSTSLPITFQGNETIQKSAFGTNVDIAVSNWNCDQNTVSCHVKAVAKKALISCTVVDQDFVISRHKSEVFASAVADFHRRLEALSES